MMTPLESVVLCRSGVHPTGVAQRPVDVRQAMPEEQSLELLHPQVLARHWCPASLPVQSTHAPAAPQLVGVLAHGPPASAPASPIPASTPASPVLAGELLQPVATNRRETQPIQCERMAAECSRRRGGLTDNFVSN
jgi:hypothetical protein